MSSLRTSQAVRNLGEFIRDQRAGAQISLRQLAKQAGISNPYLSQIERGLRKPSAEILQQIAKALRISAETLYVHAGFLDSEVDEDSDGGPDELGAAVAIRRDRRINERQKQILLEIYQTFRRENEAAEAAAEPPAGEPVAAASDEPAASWPQHDSAASDEPAAS